MSHPRKFGESFASRSEPGEREVDDEAGAASSADVVRFGGYPGRATICAGALVHDGGKQRRVRCSRDAWLQPVKNYDGEARAYIEHTQLGLCESCTALERHDREQARQLREDAPGPPRSARRAYTEGGGP